MLCVSHRVLRGLGEVYLHMLVHPGEQLGDAGVHAGLVRLRTADTPAGGSH